jgi:transcriptional regulator with PAS, ATPase and Fis domain
MQEHSSAFAGVEHAASLIEAELAATRPLTRLGVVTKQRRLAGLACASPKMRQITELLERVARTDVTVTLVGETGAGKDLLASAVHAESARASGPFVVFDCGAVAANLAESELLGHERGAFTGAVNTHAGAFERANGGTLFLDEIGELPLDLQPRLLRSLENRAVRRVGGTSYRPVDVRVIAATNRDLPALVAEGRFRQDLYFRLAGAVVPVPALRERPEDIPMLVAGVLRDLGYAHVRVTDEALQILANHQWPGNVRELKNTLGCAIAMLDGTVLEPEHLRFVALGTDCSLERLPLGGIRLNHIERVAIKQTLEQARGNKSDAARALGIAVSTLYEKLKRHGL